MWSDVSYTRRGLLIGLIFGILIFLLFVLDTILIVFFGKSLGLTVVTSFYYEFVLFPISFFVSKAIQSVSPLLMSIVSSLTIIIGSIVYGLIIGRIIEGIKSD